jgi:hypothetical protein
MCLHFTVFNLHKLALALVQLLDENKSATLLVIELKTFEGMYAVCVLDTCVLQKSVY